MSELGLFGSAIAMRSGTECNTPDLAQIKIEELEC